MKDYFNIHFITSQIVSTLDDETIQNLRSFLLYQNICSVSICRIK
nr:MAG TPA: hypothetical protein [Caudoviricetes sp.]